MNWPLLLPGVVVFVCDGNGVCVCVCSVHLQALGGRTPSLPASGGGTLYRCAQLRPEGAANR